MKPKKKNKKRNPTDAIMGILLKFQDRLNEIDMDIRILFEAVRTLQDSHLLNQSIERQLDDLKIKR
jgi:hypothetical protein